jgi:predicted exporter
LADIGYSTETIKELNKCLSEKPDNFLEPDSWQKSFGRSPSIQQIDLHKTDNGYFALILIKGVKDESELIKIAQGYPAVSYVNVVHEINNMLRDFRLQATWLAVFSYLIILLLSITRYGWRHASLIILPPLLAALSVLGLLGLFSAKLNLFHILALVLVLGIGIDYPIFFAERRSKTSATMFGILLCATTTVCSFGLMIVSRTPVLHSFGFVLVIGVIAAVIFAPLASLKD